jgi:cobalt/nickel transport system permease protein
MHMADALISPAVGGTLWAASGGVLAWCSRRVRQAADQRMVPLMGVLGAFIFAAQMINFAIPGTGSSGHLGGGLLLAILLGPHAAFIVLASVLAVQALFFADGGLLALGCNLFNLGFFPAFIAYPLVYRPLAGAMPRGGRLWVGTVLAAVVGLQLGAFAVVLETTWSGIAGLPLRTFVLLMQPIHLAIGVVEGLATAAVVSFVLRVRPPALDAGLAPLAVGAGGARRLALWLLLAAAVVGGGLSWFASTRPDGLEWSLDRAGGQEARARTTGIHQSLARIQEETAVLPDYGFRPTAPPARDPAFAAGEAPAQSAGRAGTSLAGVVGGLLVLLCAGLFGVVLRRRAV